MERRIARFTLSLAIIGAGGFIAYHGYEGEKERSELVLKSADSQCDLAFQSKPAEVSWTEETTQSCREVFLIDAENRTFAYKIENYILEVGGMVTLLYGAVRLLPSRRFL